MGVGCCWEWETADGAEGGLTEVVGYLGKLALSALMVRVCWECTAGAQAVYLLDLLAEQAWLASGL
jgi:hypothetical protein